MFFKDINAFNSHAIAYGVEREHLAALARVFSFDHPHSIVFLDIHTRYTISSAKDAIVSYPFSLISRGIGPKTRVPRGSCFSSMRTTAFSSKRT